MAIFCYYDYLSMIRNYEKIAIVQQPVLVFSWIEWSF